MNNKHIQDLTLRLSQALDQNYDVINMDAVMSVISALEGTTITKEQLEATRLAKYINQLRRRTKSEQLARRAKSLLKKWREMVGIQQQQQAQPTLPLTTLTAPISASNTTAVAASGNMSIATPAASASSAFSCLQSGINSNNLINLTTTSLTLSANLTNLNNNYNSNVNIKRAVGASTAELVPTEPDNKVVGETDAAAVMRNAGKQSQQEPLTSFAHMLSNYRRSCSNNKSTDKLTAAGDSSAAMRARQRSSPLSQQQQHMETFVIDQSPSNSNAEFPTTAQTSGGTKQQMATIIIDIQDSNSNSNVITTTTTAATATTKLPASITISPYRSSFARVSNRSPPPVGARAAEETTPPVTASKANSSSGGSASRKSRKEKKRTREQQRADVSSGNLFCPLEELSSLSQSQAALNKSTTFLADDIFRPFAEDKSNARTLSAAYPTASNILEILTLSNSSMSSMFPNELVSVKVSEAQTALQQPKLDNFAVGTNRAAPMTAAELTFAGKFKQQKGLDAGFNCGGVGSSSRHKLQMTTSPNKVAAAQQQKLFTPFNISSTAVTACCSQAGYSNDSASTNSRISQFDMVDATVSNNEPGTTISNIDSNLAAIPSNNNLLLETNSASLLPASTKLTEVAVVAPNVAAPAITASTSEKIPKKRGRKKGSRGVDSVIAKETCFTPQMLMSSLVKKVKTTKELFADMKNRKLAATAAPTTLPSSLTTAISSSTMQSSLMSRPTSSCSEPSLHSPRTFDANNTTSNALGTRAAVEKFITNTVELDTESDTLTSGEPSRDSLAGSAQRLIRRARGISIDSNSNSQFPQHLRVPTAAAGKQQLLSAEILTATVEQQLRDLLKQLPPPASKQQIELDCMQELVPCSCKVIEILPAEQPATDELQQNSNDMSNLTQDFNAAAGQLPAVLTNKLNEETPTTSTALVVANANITTPANTATNVSTTKFQTVEKPNRSIFDLDFDDDDDPLHKIVAEAAALKQTTSQDQQLTLDQPTNVPQNMLDATLVPNDVQTAETQPLIGTDATSFSAEQELQQKLRVYQVLTESDCVAKHRFEIQTQKIAEFHVNALHNCYIPNVNGNWDDANSVTSRPAAVEDDNSKQWPQDIVPKYGTLVGSERVCKDLSLVPFTPHFKPKPEMIELLHKWQSTPFLGVAYRHVEQRAIDDCVATVKTESCLKPPHGSHRYHTSCHKAQQQTAALQPVEVSVPLSATEVDDNCIVNVDVPSLATNSQTVLADNKLQVVGNNIVQLKGITVDVHTAEIDADNGSLIASQSKAVTDNASGSLSPAAASGKFVVAGNLLAIATVPQSAGLDTATFTMSSNSDNGGSQAQLDIVATLPGLTATGTTITTAATPAATAYSEAFRRGSKLEDVAKTSSRRSSSCSNSSLKQTQQCINLKLRHHRMLQQQLKQSPLHQELAMEGDNSTTGGWRKRKRQREKQRRRAFDATSVGSEKKQLIKRLKIAINGDVATQRQISVGSSNTSNSTSNTDDDDDEYMEQRQTYAEQDEEAAATTDEDELRYNKRQAAIVSMHVSDADVEDDGDEDDVADYSALRRRKKLANNTINNNCAVDNDDDVDDVAEVDDDFDMDTCNERTHELYDDYEDYDVDDDDEYDEEYNYTGDYHEVVTRDISATTNTSGNNHIVLTIKKTPSKTNSPTNSTLSAVSPVVVTATTTTAVGATLPTTSPATVTSELTTATINATTTLTPALGKPLITDAVSVSSNSSAVINTAATTTVTVAAATSLVFACATTTAATLPPNCVTQVETARAPLDVAVSSAAVPLALPCLRKRQRRLRRRIRPLLSLKFPDELQPAPFHNTKAPTKVRQAKLHRKLFFPHELCRRSAAALPGEKELILNISSNSSTEAAEDTEYEYYSSNSESTDSVGATRRRQQKRTKTVYENVTTAMQRQHSTAAIVDGAANTSGSESSVCSSLLSGTYVDCQLSDVAIKQEEAPAFSEITNSPTLVVDEKKASLLPAATGQLELESIPLSVENNGLLLSFNNIYFTPIERMSLQMVRAAPVAEPVVADHDDTKAVNALAAARKQQHVGIVAVADVAAVAGSTELQQKLKFSPKNENCDVYNNLYINNNSNINLIKYVSNSHNKQLQPTIINEQQSQLELQQQTIATTLMEQRTNINNNNNNNNCKILSKENMPIKDMYANNINRNAGSNSNNNDEHNSCTTNLQATMAAATDTVKLPGSVETQAEQKPVVEQPEQQLQQAAGQQLQPATAEQAQLRTSSSDDNNMLLPMSHKEYRTGLRSVDEDVADEQGNTCARTQQFKEWYEVLQLRSYNDELLTVLPYVVLE